MYNPDIAVIESYRRQGQILQEAARNQRLSELRKHQEPAKQSKSARSWANPLSFLGLRAHQEPAK
ncbi:MAG: hypothetical protein GXY76_20630 [Chloroflexi bacterium]|nr:hypothetical protein [Chloroflexota bacterium]